MTPDLPDGCWRAGVERLLVASSGLGGWLSNCLLLARRVGFRTKRQPVGVRSRRGSKEASSTFIRSARRGVPHVHEEDFMTVIIGIDPHKATHMAVAIDGDEQAIARLEVTADRAQTQRLLAWAAPLGDGTHVGDRVRRRARQVVVASSSSPPASMSSMCHPRCRHGCGCSGRPRRRRTTATTRCRPRSRGCATAACGRCAPTITRRCCGCWSAVTTTWSRCAPRPRVGSTRCCGSSSPAAHPGVCTR